MRLRIPGIILLTFLSLMAAVSSCKHDAIVPEGPDVSFQNDVKPVLAGHCWQSGCHGTINPDEFTLLTYEDVMEHGEVDTENATDSKIYEVITGRDDDIMPPDPNPKLSQEQINTILLWIMQGAKNN